MEDAMPPEGTQPMIGKGIKRKKRGQGPPYKTQKTSQSLATLSTTVEKNCNDIQALSALLKAMQDQAVALKALTDAVRSLSGTSVVDKDPYKQLTTSLEDATLHGGDNDPLGAFVESVIEETGSGKSNHPMHPMIQEILESNQIEQEYGPELLPRVADAFKRAISINPTKEQQEKLRLMYKAPQNVKKMGAPRVNLEIWNQLPKSIQTSDASHQFTQQFMSRAMVAQARLAEMLTENSSNIPKKLLKQLLTVAINGANQVGAAFRDMNLRRRGQIKPSLTFEGAGLCGPQVPVTDLLFGNNLDKDLVATRTSARIVRSMSAVGQRGGYRPASYPNGFGQRGYQTTSQSHN